VRANSVARRYARALFDVADQKGDADGWLSHLDALSAVTSDRQMTESFRNPGISDAAKIGALTQAFPDLPDEMKNLVRLLVIRNRTDILPGIAAAYTEYLDEKHGRVDAEVTSARPLSADEMAAIQEHLNKRTGLTVKVRTAVDESIIGGVVMRIGDEVIDASVATKLERMRQRLA
jgi:F-type H+-transporting ATPase subunit delta